ncbi:MAG: hypothetical protein HQ553_01940 [Chloroflexi bacterium]|nr:hypothetical protein [Chloroflexota bacterium]
MHKQNIKDMYAAVEGNRGFDVVIIVSSSGDQARFWQRRLEATRGSVISRNTQVISVEEDWPGGAGQLLGTLYAWQKAKTNLNLMQMLKDGRSIAMYHTAGKGTRMAPIPASEANNKSAIKLPRLIYVNREKVPMTILEAVIFQTGIFADTRPGRLCVFWGDQVFIPSKLADCSRSHHAEILDIKSEIPADAETWRTDWQSYGLVIPTSSGEALQREKQSWEDLKRLIAEGIVQSNKAGKMSLGKSLGSFSITQEFLAAMLEEFGSDLGKKQGKMDTDPHLWMPLTSSFDDFTARGGDSVHWDRIDAFKQRFLDREKLGLKLFGDKDIGTNTLWWDYGQVRLYHQNFLKLLEDSSEGECLRKFYDLEKHWIRNSKENDLTVENSIVVNTDAKGKVKNSVLMAVNADKLDVVDSVIVGSSLSEVNAEESLIYNCVDLNTLKPSPSEVVADIFLPSNGRTRMRTGLNRDGKDDWEITILGNPYSFEALGRIVGSKPESVFSSEKNKWMVYYENRSKLPEILKGIKRSFIKPAIDNLVQTVWGGDHIEKLKGLPPSGKTIGESWECSTHHQHPSIVTFPNGSKIPLNDLVNHLGEDILGRGIARDFKGLLPILVKFLDAREDLSVQVHPSDEKASELGEVDSGKTEAWLILDAEPGAVLYLGFKNDVNVSEFEKDLSSPDINIAEKYLNGIPAQVGDVLFNPAGAVHAVGKGVFLAEIQQSSGITYRVWDWNRVPKRQLHIPQAIESLNFQKTEKSDYRLIPKSLNEKEERLIDSFYFSLDRIKLANGDKIPANTNGAFQVLTCLKGEMELSRRGLKDKISRGESVLVPAMMGEYKITASKDSILLKSFVLQPQQIDPVIFQTYDVRAVADEYLSDRVCYYLGKGYGTFLRRINNADSGKLWVTIGGGIRLSTKRVREWVTTGILSTGVNVYDVGITSTPELYFSIPYLKADGGINMTASHNEAEYNGLKQVIRTEDGFIISINAEQMLEIKKSVLEGDFLEGEGKCIKLEEGEVVRYHNELVKANCRLGREIWIQLRERWENRGLKELLDITSGIKFPAQLNKDKWGEILKALDLPSNLEQPETAIQHPLEGLKVVIDFGNGSGWRTKGIFTDLGAEVVAINETPDGYFPAHIPDPIKAKYRKQLEEAVIKEAADSSKEVIGIGNDEDADRVIYVRKDGRVVEGDRTLAIQAQCIIDEHKKMGKPGKPRFMGEVKFSRIAEECITSNGGEYITSPTGFAFIKDGTKALVQALQEGSNEIELFGKRIDLSDNKEPIALAAELSGHQMSGHEENWIFDDAALAAIKLLTVVANGLREGKSFIDIDEAVPRYPATPELNIRLKVNVLDEKQEVVDVAVQRFREMGYTIYTTDGGLIKWFDNDSQWLGQALVRKSNTQPMIICRVEGKDVEAKQSIEDEFFTELSKISTKSVPHLDLASDDYIRDILPRIQK